MQIEVAASQTTVGRQHYINGMGRTPVRITVINPVPDFVVFTDSQPCPRILAQYQYVKRLSPHTLLVIKANHRGFNNEVPCCLRLIIEVSPTLFISNGSRQHPVFGGRPVHRKPGKWLAGVIRRYLHTQTDTLLNQRVVSGLDHLTKNQSMMPQRYGDLVGLRGVTVAQAQGEFVVLIID
ncbi:hypothetical protein D3C81_1518720 [compost metagenome]